MEEVGVGTTRMEELERECEEGKKEEFALGQRVRALERERDSLAALSADSLALGIKTDSLRDKEIALSAMSAFTL